MRKQSRFIFIVGAGRSGTTLMARILGRHNEIFSFEELHFFEQLWAGNSSDDTISRKVAIKTIAKLIAIQRTGYFRPKQYSHFVGEAEKAVELDGHPATLLDAFATFLSYETHRRGKQIGCEQTPRNALYVKDILRRFPNAKILHLVRDPRDIALSQKLKWRRRSLGGSRIPLKEAVRSWFNYHPWLVSKLWVAANAAVEEVSKSPNVLTLRFEDLLSDPRKNVQEICRFVNIEFQEEMLEVPQVGSSVRADTPDKFGIDTSRASGWRGGGLTANEIAMCEKVTESWLERYGYCKTFIHSPRVCKWLSIIGFSPKFLIALLLNATRFKDPLEAIRRRLRG